MPRAERSRLGGWLTDTEAVRKCILRLKTKAATNSPDDYALPIKALKIVVALDPLLNASTQGMFVEAKAYSSTDPTGQPTVESWDEFLGLLNAIMTVSPEFIVDNDDGALGLVAVPINALLDWPMGSASGYLTFSNPKFNRYFKKVLEYWGLFLSTSDSRYSLGHGTPPGVEPRAIAWFSDPAKAQLVEVAMKPFPGQPPKPFTEIFVCPDPNDPLYLGFSSWDAFFVREFQPGLREVGETIIVNACESAPLQLHRNVSLSANILLKGQPYSLIDMLNNDPLAPQFAGGMVYQGFLSALSYHRWHSPVDGIIERTFVVDGSYYLSHPAQGLYSNEPDDEANVASQPFLTAVATRAVMFIRANDPAIGLMVVVAVGMVEVSSCEITVAEHQPVQKGDEIGMFHFGGSTHCLVFQPGVNLEFLVDVTHKPNLNATNVAVRSNLARLKAN